MSGGFIQPPLAGRHRGAAVLCGALDTAVLRVGLGQGRGAALRGSPVLLLYGHDPKGWGLQGCRVIKSMSLNECCLKWP